MNNLLSKIKNLKNDPWTLGNSVLYKLCKDYPHHKTDNEIAAKIWLIGRAYAASIERRKGKDEIINDDFYLGVVIPQIKQSGIDKWIQSCKSKGTKDTYLSVHKKITDLFERISGSKKRSLASKYLHFHLPNMFFMYDSRSSKGIGLLFKELNIGMMIREINNNLSDKSYASFYNKCLKAQDEIHIKYNVSLGCRQLDTLLINLANENLRK